MNERIKEIAKQAAAVEGWGPEVWQTTFSEKFAELIVRECARVQHERFCKEGDVSWDLLMQHFGIES